MRKRLSTFGVLLLGVLLVVVFIVLGVSCFSESEGNIEWKLSYTLNEDGKSYSVEAEIPSRRPMESRKCDAEIVVIPSTYNQLPVTVIDYNAFEGFYKLKRIEIPETVTTIRQSAFAECTMLREVKFSDNIKTIDDFVFWNCISLNKINMPEGLTSIGSMVFFNCASLKNVRIPNSVTSIGFGAFLLSGCYNNEKNWQNNGLYIGKWLLEIKEVEVEEFTVANGTVGIAESAFSRCEATDLHIPKSVKHITRGAFVGFKGLKNLYYQGNLLDWCNISFDSADNDTGDIDAHYIPENFYLNGVLLEGELVIPTTVREIKAYSFSHYRKITKVVIPNTVSVIGEGAFKYCYKLTEAVIPDTVTEIHAYAFYACRELADIEFPENITFIGKDSLFDTAYYNEESHWENNALYIGDYLLKADVNYVGEYTVKPGTQYIAQYAFFECSGYHSIEIPSSVIDIGEWAFADCYTLPGVKIPVGITAIKENTFRNCYNLERVEIPETVTEIGYLSFYYCYSLTEISFGGTMEQWNAIDKAHYWNLNVPATKVVCKDGEVLL